METLNYSNIFDRKAPAQKLEYRAAAVAGRFGGGKTAFLTFHAVNQEQTAHELFNHAWSYSQICANYHLKGIDNFKYLDPRLTQDDLVKEIGKKSLLLIDEADEYFSNRESMCGEQIDRVKFFNQIRKRQCDVIINIPFLTWLDKRLKEIFTDFFKCAGRSAAIINGRDTEFNKYMIYQIKATPSGNLFFYDTGKEYLIEAGSIYSYYDHEEYVQKTPITRDDLDAKTINKMIKQLKKIKEYIEE